MKGTTIKKKYKIIKVLRQDLLTETFLAQGQGLSSFKRYAIKKFRPILGNPQAREIKHLFSQEADILKLLSGKNPQIPQLHDYFVDGEDFYLVREWIEGITLEQKVVQNGKLPEQEVVKILSSILSVLQYIHQHGLVYRELSPSSIVLRQQNSLPVPIYFSGIEELEKEAQKLNQRSLALVNQPEYVSPEPEHRLVCASDFYSLGLTAIYLLTSKTPAELNVNPYTKRLLWHQEIPNLSINLARVIDRAISPNLSDRFTSAEEMSNALSPQSVIISEFLITQQKVKPRFTPEVKMIAALSCLSLGAIGIVFTMLNFDFGQLTATKIIADDVNDIEDLDLPKESLKSKQSDSISQASAFNKVASPQAVLNIPAFRIGTSQEQLINSLGTPTNESRGYWGNSRAFLYKNFAQQQVDLGYLSDIATQTIMQSEMSFAESVKKVEIQYVLKQLLMADYSAEIEQQIEQIINGKSDKQEFSEGNLEGIIQRNAQNRIYLGVWQAGFHN